VEGAIDYITNIMDKPHLKEWG